jgi:hypothetical protein
MGRQVSFRIVKGWLVFEEHEIMTMLKAFPAIWEEALRRGKRLMRAEKEGQRKAK